MSNTELIAEARESLAYLVRDGRHTDGQYDIGATVSIRAALDALEAAGEKYADVVSLANQASRDLTAAQAVIAEAMNHYDPYAQNGADAESMHAILAAYRVQP